MVTSSTYYHIHTVGPGGESIDREGYYKVKNPEDEDQPTPGPGTNDYDDLIDKPTIDGKTLIKGLTAKELGLEEDMDPISAEEIDAITG